MEFKHLKLLLLLFFPLLASAGVNERFVEEILANNPGLKAERAAAAAEIVSRVADNRLDAAEVGFAYKWPSQSAEVTKLEFEVTQSFDWPGVYGVRRRAAAASRTALTARAAASRRALQRQTRGLLNSLVNQNRRVELLQQMLQNLDSLHCKLHQMLVQGATTELEHRKLEIEEVAMKQQLGDAQLERTQTLTAIAELNGGTLPAGLSDINDYGPGELLPLGDYLARENLEAQALNAEASALELDSRAERMGLAPGFSVGYVMEKEGPVFFNGFSVGLRLPRYAAKPRAEALRLQALSARAQAETADSLRRQALTATHADAQRTQKLIDDYNEAFGSDYQLLLQKALQGGAITYVSYLTELNFYLAARMDLLSAQLNLANLLNDLNFSI